MRLVVLVLCGALAGACGVALAAHATPATKPVPARDVRATPIGRFDFPTYVTAPPGDTHRLFVVEKAGRIRVMLDGRTLPAPFLDISSDVLPGNEPGLLSLAFSPGYDRNGLFYIYYSGTDKHTHLLEFRRSSTNPNRADKTTRRQVLSLDHPSGEHFGGLLLFGPGGKLYLSTGDGGLSEWQDKIRAQQSDNPNGKILRVNPVNGSTHVVAKGLRNPWRYTIDPKTHDLYVGDAGEYVRESVEYAPAARVQGANFGWPCFEGSIPSTQYPANMCPGARPPLYEYAREGGNCSIIGGVVIHDPRLRNLDGAYVYGDYCLGELIVLRTKHGGLASKRSLRIYEPSLTSFGTDAGNRVYFTTAAGVFRIDPAGAKSAKRGPAPVTGRELFLASGCGTCHILAAANTGGTYGPNLDLAKPSHELVVERIKGGKGAMPSFSGRLTEKQIQVIATFVAKG